MSVSPLPAAAGVADSSVAARLAQLSATEYAVLMNRFKLLNLVQRVAHRDVKDMIDAVGLDALAFHGTGQGWVREGELERQRVSADAGRAPRWTTGVQAVLSKRTTAAARRVSPKGTAPSSKKRTVIHRRGDERLSRHSPHRSPKTRTSAADGGGDSGRLRTRMIFRSRADEEAFVNRLAEPRRRLGEAEDFGSLNDISIELSGEDDRDGACDMDEVRVFVEEEEKAGGGEGNAEALSRRTRDGKALSRQQPIRLVPRRLSPSASSSRRRVAADARHLVRSPQAASSHRAGGVAGGRSRNGTQDEAEYDAMMSWGSPSAAAQHRAAQTALDNAETHTQLPHDSASAHSGLRGAPAHQRSALSGSARHAPLVSLIASATGEPLTATAHGDGGGTGGAGGVFSSSGGSPFQTIDPDHMPPHSHDGVMATAGAQGPPPSPEGYQPSVVSGTSPLPASLAQPTTSSPLFPSPTATTHGAPLMKPPSPRVGLRSGGGLAPKSKPKQMAGVADTVGSPLEVVKQAAAMLISRMPVAPPPGQQQQGTTTALASSGSSFPHVNSLPAGGLGGDPALHSVAEWPGASGSYGGSRGLPPRQNTPLHLFAPQQPRASATAFGMAPAAASQHGSGSLPQPFPSGAQMALALQQSGAPSTSTVNEVSGVAVAGAGEAYAAAAAGASVYDSVYLQELSRVVNGMLRDHRRILREVVKEDSSTNSTTSTTEPGGEEGGRGAHVGRRAPGSGRERHTNARKARAGLLPRQGESGDVDADDSMRLAREAADSVDAEVEDDEEADEMLLFARLQRKVSHMDREIAELATRASEADVLLAETRATDEAGTQPPAPPTTAGVVSTDAERSGSPPHHRTRRVRGTMPVAVVNRLISSQKVQQEYIAYNERLWNTSHTSQYVFAQRLTNALLEDCVNEVLEEVEGIMDEYVDGLAEHELQ